MLNPRLVECTCGSQRVVGAFTSKGKAIDVFCLDCNTCYSFTVRKADKSSYVEFFSNQKARLSNAIQEQ